MTPPDSMPSTPPPPPGQTPVPECWRHIGVYGDGTCPALGEQVHCRNCPVYTRAGRCLLNRPLPADYRREWAAHVAGAKPRAAVKPTSATLFRLGVEWLALDTVLFQEVAEHRPMHILPHRQMSVVLGLVNVRGELLLCVSLGRLLGLGHELPRVQPRAGYRRLLVIGPGRIAFPVDEVYGVHRLNRDELQPPPATVGHAARTCTRGVFRWQQHTVGYLDGETLLLNLERSLT